MGLIQTAEQLRFSYQAIIEGAKELSKSCEDTEVFKIFISKPFPLPLISRQLNPEILLIKISEGKTSFGNV